MKTDLLSRLVLLVRAKWSDPVWSKIFAEAILRFVSVAILAVVVFLGLPSALWDRISGGYPQEAQRPAASETEIPRVDDTPTIEPKQGEFADVSVSHPVAPSLPRRPSREVGSGGGANSGFRTIQLVASEAKPTFQQQPAVRADRGSIAAGGDIRAGDISLTVDDVASGQKASALRYLAAMNFSCDKRLKLLEAWRSGSRVTINEFLSAAELYFVWQGVDAFGIETFNELVTRAKRYETDQLVIAGSGLASPMMGALTDGQTAEGLLSPAVNSTRDYCNAIRRVLAANTPPREVDSAKPVANAPQQSRTSEPEERSSTSVTASSGSIAAGRDITVSGNITIRAVDAEEQTRRNLQTFLRAAYSDCVAMSEKISALNANSSPFGGAMVFDINGVQLMDFESYVVLRNRYDDVVSANGRLWEEMIRRLQASSAKPGDTAPQVQAFDSRKAEAQKHLDSYCRAILARTPK